MTSDELQSGIGEWQVATFGHSHNQEIVKHLIKEVVELAVGVGIPCRAIRKAWEDAYAGAPDISEAKEESADCMHLLYGLAYNLNFSLLSETEAKFAVNKARKWGNPVDGVVEHIRTDDAA